MFDIILLFIILIALILIIKQNLENMDNHNFKYLNSKSSLFVNNNVYSKNELIELTNLPNCQVDFSFDYGSNFNTIVNNGISIYQDMVDPLEHTIEVDNVNYNLTSIRWKASKFTYNKQQVGLELHLIHQNFNSINKVIIVIPLSLTDDNVTSFTDQTVTSYNEELVTTLDKENDTNKTKDANETQNTKEGFKNIGYKKFMKDTVIYTDTILSDNSIKNFVMPAYFQIKNETKNLLNSQKKMFDLKIKNNFKNISLNKLITSPVLIPTYECCTDKIGQSMRFNLCDVQEILRLNPKYYELEDTDSNKYFITEPVEYNEELGLSILDNLYYDTNISFLK